MWLLHCPFPLNAPGCNSNSWVKVVCSAASVRGMRVLSAAGVSSPRSDSVFLRRCVVDTTRCDAHRPTTTKRFHSGRLGQQQRGLQRAARSRAGTYVSATPPHQLPYTMVTDASRSATGGVLMQDQGNGLQPLAFLNRQLKPTEQRYSTYERELAAVAYCL